MALPSLSSPEEDHIQGFSVQAPFRLSKSSVLAQVDELKVVHAQLMDAACRASLTDAVVLAIHAEVLEALLKRGVGLKTCTSSNKAGSHAVAMSNLSSNHMTQ